MTEFYQKIAVKALDVNEVLDKYIEQQKRDNDTHDEIVYRSAEGYNLQATQEETTSKEDVLVIDQNLKGFGMQIWRSVVILFTVMSIRFRDGKRGN